MADSKLFKPNRFDTEADGSKTAHTAWLHWLHSFNSFYDSLTATQRGKAEPFKFNLLVNHVAPHVFEHISDKNTFDEAIEVLQSLYVQPVNEIAARNELHTRYQRTGETLDQYLQALKLLAKPCNFIAVSAAENRNDNIRDAFIRGLSSNEIRCRLLENNTLTMNRAYELARSLELATKNTALYNVREQGATNSTVSTVQDMAQSLSSCHIGNHENVNAVHSQKCYFCGHDRHPRNICPAKDAICGNCDKKGHYAKVCKSPRKQKYKYSKQSSASISAYRPPSDDGYTAILGAVTPDNAATYTEIGINNCNLKALCDTGSNKCYISPAAAKKTNLHLLPYQGVVSMAATEYSVNLTQKIVTDINIKDRVYSNITFYVMKDLCAEAILGQDFFAAHKSVCFNFGGLESTLNIENSGIDTCGLTVMNITPPKLFENLTPECKPIATKSRKFCQKDVKFIDQAVSKLIDNDKIEDSTSAWRSQLLVTTEDDNHKSRLVVDYSQTINRFTELDAYPMPNIEDMVRTISQYNYFSTYDLKSAYHQIPLSPEERHYTAFEANGKLYQFKVVPFGVTNGAAKCQRIMDHIIKEGGVSGCSAFQDNIFIYGKTRVEHDKNLQDFLKAAKSFNMVFNDSKSVISTTSLPILGYVISNGEIKPDPQRLEPLRKLPPPTDLKSQKRCVGMFAYYSHWISKFSEKIRPLITNEKFPLSETVLKSFELMKTEIANSVVHRIDYDIPFEVETDASEHTIAASLNQAGRPVAFFTRTLNKSELSHSAVEKEAYAIVESIKQWKHFLLGRHFKLITDQKSVSFMFHDKHQGKIKNDKILRWRIELSPFKYDIIYRPGAKNVVADTFSRMTCSHISSNNNSLLNLHISLCHPGVTRMYHLVRSRNLPYSIDDVKNITKSCMTCCEIKPRFIKSQGTLIKATQPWERISIDFKGPLKTTTRNKYMLTVIDEYSRMPFAFPCPNMHSSTVIKCLTSLFSLFGSPGYVHSDRASDFLSQEVKDFLLQNDIASSKTSRYNPQGNAQCERYNGIIWQTITLALKSNNFPIEQWEKVLPQALHSIRTLLCTTTNCSPHERFFNFVRRSKSGTSLPSWVKPGPVLLKKKTRSSKYDPIVETVELIQANPQYAFVKMPNGRECTVSLRDLAPCGDCITDNSNHVLSDRDPKVGNTELRNPTLNTPTKQSITNNDGVLKDNSLVFCQDEDESVTRSPSGRASVDHNITSNKHCITPKAVSTPVRRSERERKAPNKLDL